MGKKQVGIIVLIFQLLVIFSIYIHTTYPTFNNGDSPEIAAGAFTLGIVHPPSYPLYTMAAKIFTLIPYGSPAFRVNVFSCFLAVVVLIVTFYVLKSNSRIFFGTNKPLFDHFAIFVLAFSYIFWNQSIEAKGGIYVLNLLFLSLLILLCQKIFINFKIKYLYAASYIYGLSFANHWPSMVILLPVFLFGIYKAGNKIKPNNVLNFFLLFILGLSAYIYLPIRAMKDGAFILMARPDNWHEFFWTIFRMGYDGSINATFSDIQNQLMEFVSLFKNSYYFIILLMLPGIYIVWKKNRMVALFYSSIFIITSTAVLLNRTPKDYLMVVDNFLMPAEYIVVIIITAGLYYVDNIIRSKKLKAGYIFILSLLLIFNFWINFIKNDSRRNFLAYDFGNNTIKWLSPPDIYFYNGDYYSMPLVYLDVVEHKMAGIKHQTFYSLKYNWGLDKLKGNTGVELNVNDDVDTNIAKIIDSLFIKNRIFINGYPQDIDKKIGNYEQKIYGILTKVSEDSSYYSPLVFDIYSYRGLTDLKNNYDKQLAAVYSASMTQRAGEYLKTKQYQEAIKMYKKALAIPAYNNLWKIYFNLSVAYRFNNDPENQLNCLLEVIKIMPQFYRAYEDAGSIYWNLRQFNAAREMFEYAIRCGSPNSRLLQQYIYNLR
jgi:tetratricopeptide (TPR) repeat protein